jgi:predicted dehydrogenase
MPKKLRWGVLSTASIGLRKVIPAMQQGEYTTVVAIASRDLAKAQEAAKAHGIRTAYGSYEERGRIELEIPFNAPLDRPTRLFVDDGSDLSGRGVTTETFPVCNQYTAQGDAFSRAVLENTEVPVPLEDAIKNMAVIDAILHSADTGEWASMP